MVSKKPRKQRKRLYNAPLHIRMKRLSSPLHPELRAKYGRRTVVVRKGDLVKVMRGGSTGHVGKVVRVDSRGGRLTIEKLTLVKADGKQVEKWVNASNVMVVKLDEIECRSHEGVLTLLEALRRDRAKHAVARRLAER
ncbi:MAG TPA: 50S ribosomal protein L24, partial [Thermoplasmata archaeon]|nr:50S ribosomal protein L24 [Thermoplasmata archaeon]